MTDSNDSLKKCRTCGIEKQPYEYSADKGHSSGISSRCKLCARKYHADYRQRNRRKINEKLALWRAENPEKYQAIRQRHSKKINHAERSALFRKNNPEKYKAHKTVENAIRDKRLFRMPCRVCGSLENVHAHHEDYSRPLHVDWLCSTHHNQLHHGKSYEDQ